MYPAHFYGSPAQMGAPILKHFPHGPAHHGPQAITSVTPMRGGPAAKLLQRQPFGRPTPTGAGFGHMGQLAPLAPKQILSHVQPLPDRLTQSAYLTNLLLRVISAPALQELADVVATTERPYLAAVLRAIANAASAAQALPPPAAEDLSTAGQWFGQQALRPQMVQSLMQELAGQPETAHLIAALGEAGKVYEAIRAGRRVERPWSTRDKLMAEYDSLSARNASPAEFAELFNRMRGLGLARDADVLEQYEMYRTGPPVPAEAPAHIGARVVKHLTHAADYTVGPSGASLFDGPGGNVIGFVFPRTTLHQLSSVLTNTHVPPGTFVPDIISDGSETWLHIVTNESLTGPRRGWIKKSALLLGQPAEPLQIHLKGDQPAQMGAPIIKHFTHAADYTVGPYGANLYDAPGGSGIGFINPGTTLHRTTSGLSSGPSAEFSVLGDGSIWYQIMTNESTGPRRGWVKASQLEPQGAFFDTAFI